MEIADFIQDKKIVAKLTADKSKDIYAKVANKFDCFLLCSFLALGSMIITLVPGVLNQKFNRQKISELSLESQVNYQRAKDFFAVDNKYQLSSEQIKLVNYLEKDIINRVNYQIEKPRELAMQIVNASSKAQEDPFFITALIFSESSFRREAKSSVGALGLMQIMPTTGKYIAEKIKYQWSNSQSLKQPEVNLKLGIAYLQYLKKMFKNDTHKVLLAYNWGPTNVIKGKRPPSVSLKYSNKIHRLTNKWKTDFISGYPDTKLLALNSAKLS